MVFLRTLHFDSNLLELFNHVKQHTFTSDQLMGMMLDSVSETFLLKNIPHLLELTDKTFQLCIQRDKLNLLAAAIKNFIPQLQNQVVRYLIHNDYGYDVYKSLSSLKNLDASLETWLESSFGTSELVRNLGSFEKSDHAELFQKLYDSKDYKGIVNSIEFFPTTPDKLFQEIVINAPELTHQLIVKFSNLRHVDIVSDIETLITSQNTTSKINREIITEKLLERIELPFSAKDQKRILAFLLDQKLTFSAIKIALKTNTFSKISQSEILQTVAETQLGVEALARSFSEVSGLQKHFTDIPNDVFQKVLPHLRDPHSLIGILKQVDTIDQIQLAEYLFDHDLQHIFFNDLSVFDKVPKSFIVQRLSVEEIHSLLSKVHYINAESFFSADEIISWISTYGSMAKFLMGETAQPNFYSLVAQSLTVEKFIELFNNSDPNADEFSAYYFAHEIYGDTPITTSEYLRMWLKIKTQIEEYPCPFKHLAGAQFSDFEEVYKSNPDIFTFDDLYANIHMIAWETFPTDFFIRICTQQMESKYSQRKFFGLLPWIASHLPQEKITAIQQELSTFVTTIPVRESLEIINYFYTIDRIDGIALFIALYAQGEKLQELTHWLRTLFGTKKLEALAKRLRDEQKVSQLGYLKKISPFLTLDGKPLSSSDEAETSATRTPTEVISLEESTIPEIDLYHELGIFYAYQLLEQKFVLLTRNLEEQHETGTNNLIVEPKEFKSIRDRAALAHIKHTLNTLAIKHQEKLLEVLQKHLIIAINEHSFSNSDIPSKEAYKKAPRIPRATMHKDELNLVLKQYSHMYSRVGRKDWKTITNVAHQMTLPNANSNAAFLIDLATDLEHSSGFIFTRSDTHKLKLKGQPYSNQRYSRFLDKKSAVHSIEEWIAYLKENQFVDKQTLSNLERLNTTLSMLQTATTRTKGYE